MDKKLMLIANPNAGKGKARASMGTMIEVFAKNGWLTTVYLTSGPGDATRFAREAAGDYGLCVTCGGDGTLSEVIAGLVNCENAPLLGYIPMGTANDVASSLGLSKNIGKAAQNIMDGHEISYDVGCFDNGAYFTYVAAFGAFTEVSYQTPQAQKAQLGHLAYVLEGMRSVTKITSNHVVVEHDGQRLEDEYIFGSVTNSTSVAGLVKLKPDEVSLSDGLFEVMLIKRPKDIIELGRIITSITQNNYDPKYVSFFHTAEVKFTFDKPVAWTRDGEAGGTHSEVVIKNKHEAVRIQVPGGEA